MKIAGLDLSISSSGVVVEELNDLFEVISAERYGFADTRKNIRETIIPGNDIKSFDNSYQRYKFIADNIFEWCKDCEYVAIEDIATHAQGMIIDLAEFEGYIKMSLFNMGKKVRLYSVKTNKKFFSGHGDSDKIGMYQSFLKWPHKLPSISDLPIVVNGKKGTKPTSDIVDAASLCELLRFELRLKNCIIKMSELPKYQQEVFNGSPDKNRIPLLNKQFITLR